MQTAKVVPIEHFLTHEELVHYVERRYRQLGYSKYDAIARAKAEGEA